MTSQYSLGRAVSPPATADIPEAVIYGARLWGIAVIADLAHIVVSTIMLIIDPHVLSDSAAEKAPADITPAMQHTAVIATIVMLAVLRVMFVVVSLWAVGSVINPRRTVDSRLKWRSILLYFSVFFAAGAVMVLVGQPDDAPVVATGFVMGDGIAQIVAAVAAVTAMVLFFRPETKDFIEATSTEVPSGGNGPGGARGSAPHGYHPGGVADRPREVSVDELGQWSRRSRQSPQAPEGHDAQGQVHDDPSGQSRGGSHRRR